MLNPRSGAYGGGYGDFFGYQDLLTEWRANGDFDGFALEMEDAIVSIAVVTGGAVGIGAAIAEELGRAGVYVVTVDPGVAVDGSPGEGGAEATTAQRIVDAGGQARASNISVTDADAVRDAVHRPGRGVRCARRGGERRRHQPSHRVRPRRRRRLARGAQRAPRRLPQRVARRPAAHDRGRPRPHPRRHVRIRLARRRRRRLQLREAGCRRAHLAHRAGDTAGRHRQRALADRGDPHGPRRALASGRCGVRGRLRRPEVWRSGSPRCRRPSTSDRSVRTSRARRSRRGRAVRSCSRTGPRSRGSSRRRLLEVARTSDVGSLLAVLESFAGKVLAPAEAAQAATAVATLDSGARSRSALQSAAHRRAARRSRRAP